MHIKKRYQEYLQILEKSKSYVEKLDMKKENEKAILFTGGLTNENDLKCTLLQEPKIEEERKEIIEETSKDIITKSTNFEEYIENLSKFRSANKNQILYSIHNEPEKYIPMKEAEQSQENSIIYKQGNLASFLNNNGITAVIERNITSNNYNIAVLQLITSGEAFREVIQITHDFGDEANIKIVYDENERESFKAKKRAEFSKIFGVEENQIIISNIRIGSLKYDLLIKGKSLNQNDISLIKQDKTVLDAKIRFLIEGCKFLLICLIWKEIEIEHLDGDWAKKRAPWIFERLYSSFRMDWNWFKS